MLQGGINSRVSENAFVDEFQVYKQLYPNEKLIQDLEKNLGEFFFSKLQSPLIRIDLPSKAESSDEI